MTCHISNYGLAGGYVALSVALTGAVTQSTLEGIAGAVGKAYGRCVTANNVTGIACTALSASIDTYKAASLAVDIVVGAVITGVFIFVAIKSRKVHQMTIRES